MIDRQIDERAHSIRQLSHQNQRISCCATQELFYLKNSNKTVLDLQSQTFIKSFFILDDSKHMKLWVPVLFWAATHTFLPVLLFSLQFLIFYCNVSHIVTGSWEQQRVRELLEVRRSRSILVTFTATFKNKMTNRKPAELWRTSATRPSSSHRRSRRAGMWARLRTPSSTRQ